MIQILLIYIKRYFINIYYLNNFIKNFTEFKKTRITSDDINKNKELLKKWKTDCQNLINKLETQVKSYGNNISSVGDLPVNITPLPNPPEIKGLRGINSYFRYWEQYYKFKYFVLYNRINLIYNQKIL